MKRSIYLRSSDSKNRMHVCVWEPNQEPVAVLQIVHGMVEYIERYDEFAAFLNENRIAVIGADMLGHGKTASCREDLGFFAETNGKTYIMKDTHRVSLYAKMLWPGKPFFILGHSMGSFMVRRYITKWGSEANGAIIMGTGDIPLAAASFGKILSYLYTVLVGARCRSKVLEFLVLGMNQLKYRLAGKGSWLSRSVTNSQKYENDPLCGFNFTASAYHTLFTLLCELANREDNESIPKDLSLLFVSGSDDPLGGPVKGVLNVYNSLAGLGMQDLDLKLYKDDRHEILNEDDRETVFNDILFWITKRQ